MWLGFTRKEFLFICFVVLAIAGITKLNLIDSYRKSRDVTRKNDLSDIMNKLDKFHERIGYYPASNDQGQILGCQGFSNLKEQWEFKPCNWGDNSVNSPYMGTLPQDPKVSEGYKYRYTSNGESYQLFASLEGSREDEFDQQIVSRNLNCGLMLCNAGRTNLRDKRTLHAPLPNIVKKL